MAGGGGRYSYVRPVTAWISHTLVSTPLSWAGLHVQVPVLLRDYLSVGFILALSFHRADFAASPSPKGKGRLRRVARNVAGRLRVPTNRSRGGRFSLAAWLLWPPLQILIWPVVSFVLVMLLLLPAVIYVTRYHKENPIGRQAFKVFLTSLAPLVYLGVLFAVNYLVLR